MRQKFLLILFSFVYTSSFSQTIEYNGKNKYKLDQALKLIKNSDPSYYQILSSVAGKISTTKNNFSYPVLDSLGSDWILIQESMLFKDDYKYIASTIIHESLHLFYRTNGQYLNFSNVYEERGTGIFLRNEFSY